MQKFKIKSLYLAMVAAIGSAGIAGTASAQVVPSVHINPNGLGQVLIYPYYTTRAGMDTYLSVVNTTASSKAVKVRFTEGKNSREVLDFNLYLSPRDMWTAAVVNSKDGARLITADKSCTSPAIPATIINPDFSIGGGQPFTNNAYTGKVIEDITDNGGDGETNSLDRTREGYFEIIEMGVITNTAIEASITHVSGVPANCAVVQAPTMRMGISGASAFPSAGKEGSSSAAVVAPAGGLAGTASLINVAAGTDFGYDPVALGYFSNKNIWFAPGIISPDLRNGVNTSVVFNEGKVLTSTWNVSDTVDAVSAVLMHDNIINEFVLDNATLSGTDWVVTMPTKRYYVPVDDGSIITAEQGLFFDAFRPFTKTFWTGGACEPVSLSYWNREEGNVTNVGFSPPSPGGGTTLCWEANVVTFNDSAILGSVNSTNVNIATFENGWLNMNFNDLAGGHKLVDVAGNTYHGLPTVGFMLQDFINQKAAAGLLATYGGNFSHKYTVLRTTPQ